MLAGHHDLAGGLAVAGASPASRAACRGGRGGSRRAAGTPPASARRDRRVRCAAPPPGVTRPCGAGIDRARGRLGPLLGAAAPAERARRARAPRCRKPARGHRTAIMSRRRGAVVGTRAGAGPGGGAAAAIASRAGIWHDRGMRRAPASASALALALCRRGGGSPRAGRARRDRRAADAGVAAGAAAATPRRRRPARGAPRRPGRLARLRRRPSGKPLLGVTAFVATVYKEPRDTSKKLGYLRVGAVVPRSAEPAGKADCPGGWYEIEPQGLRLRRRRTRPSTSTPRSSARRRKRPNLQTALPYHYAFVRAVLPMYLRVPTAEEQYKSEFKLKEHLDWYKDNARRGLQGRSSAPTTSPSTSAASPSPDKKLGELGLSKNSQRARRRRAPRRRRRRRRGAVVARGRQARHPQHQRLLVPGFESFADRARRHTGLCARRIVRDRPGVAEPALRRHHRSSPRAGDQDQARQRLALARHRARRRAHAAARLRAIASARARSRSSTASS